MKHHFSLALTAFVVVSLAAPVAAAPNGTATPQPDPKNASIDYSDVETIDNATLLLDSSLDVEAGVATVRIKSEIPQKIVISDSGDFVKGGQVDQRSVYLRPGETATIEMPVTIVDQGLGNEFAGLSITTSKTLYSEPLKTSSPLIGGPWTYRDAQVVGLTMAVVVGSTVVVILLRGKYDLDASPERVA